MSSAGSCPGSPAEHPHLSIASVLPAASGKQGRGQSQQRCWEELSKVPTTTWTCSFFLSHCQDLHHTLPPRPVSAYSCPVASSIKFPGQFSVRRGPLTILVAIVLLKWHSLCPKTAQYEQLYRLVTLPPINWDPTEDLHSFLLKKLYIKRQIHKYSEVLPLCLHSKD